MRGVLAVVVLCAAALAADTPHYDSALSLYRSNQCERALHEFDLSESAGENAPERPFYQGACLAKTAQWDRASARLRPWAALHPEEFRGWYWLAQAELYGKRFPAAREAILRAIALDNQSASAQRTLGEIELQLNNYDAAYRAWVAANKLDPTDARTTYYIGRLFFEADFPNEAAQWLRRTLTIAPHHFAAMTYLAMCAERLNMQDTAIELYVNAVRESKEQKSPHPWAFLNYAKMLRQLGRDAEALALLEEGEKLCPEAHLLTQLGLMLASSQPARAEAVLRRAIAMDGSIPDAHYRLAMMLRSSGRTDEARAEMQRFQDAKAAEERNKVTIQAVRKQP